MCDMPDDIDGGQLKGSLILLYDQRKKKNEDCALTFSAMFLWGIASLL